ncbi:MAG: hypothetical protein ACLURV_09140 [Gallintestinimicrobium sp.]
MKAADVKILPIPMETGLIAEVKGEKDGPVQALRCDIDALPITELDGFTLCVGMSGKDARLRARFSHHGGNRDRDLAAGT